MFKKLWSFAVDFWRDGNALLGFVAAPLSIAFTVAKALDMPALSHLREVSYAWALAPLLLWVFVAYVRRRSHTLQSSLKMSFGIDVPGCVSHDVVTYPPGKPHKQSTHTWYRIRVDADGSTNVTGCKGRILSIKRGDRELLVGDLPVIAFTPADQPDALNKDINPPVPEFLDFLSANVTNGINHVIKSHMSQKVDWAGMFLNPDDYYLTIAVSSREAQTATIKIKFKWTLDPVTSELTTVA